MRGLFVIGVDALFTHISQLTTSLNLSGLSAPPLLDAHCPCVSSLHTGVFPTRFAVRTGAATRRVDCSSWAASCERWLSPIAHSQQDIVPKNPCAFLLPRAHSSP